MIEAPSDHDGSSEGLTEMDEPTAREPRDLADRMTDALLGDGGDAPAWDREFPPSCGKGWG